MARPPELGWDNAAAPRNRPARAAVPAPMIHLALAFTLLCSSCAHRGAVAAVADAGPAPALAPSPEARQILEAGAADPDFQLRARALYWLVRASPEPAGGAWAQRGLWDPEPWVRRSAVRGLAARISEPAARERLLELVARPQLDPYVRGAAGLELALAGDNRAMEPLQRALAATRDGYSQAPVALALARAGDPQALSQLQAAIREGELPLDLDFIADIQRAALPALEPALLEGLEMAEEPLQLPLAGLLASLNNRKGEELLREALGADELRALEALDVVRRLPPSQGAPLLQRAHQSASGLARVQAELVQAARAGGPLDQMKGGLESEERELRLMAIEALGELRRGPAVEPRVRREAEKLLEQALGDAEPELRQEALEALGAHSALVALLKDDAPAIRLEAAGLLSTPRG